MKTVFESDLPFFTKDTNDALVQFRTTAAEKEEFYERAGKGAPELLRWSFQETLKLLRARDENQAKAS